MGDEPLKRRVYERHLDLLLAEELECRAAFARWFLTRMFDEDDLPESDPVAVTVAISRVDNELDDTADGEDDLFVTAIDPDVKPDAMSMRTVNTTWLFFEPANWLILKLDRGLVDIYPAKAQPGYDPDQSALPPPDGFTHDTDTVGNIVLRWRSPGPFDLAALRNGQRPATLIEALHACSRANTWLKNLTGI